jgi:hypothetical protein
VTGADHPGRRIPVFVVTDGGAPEQAVSGTKGHVPRMRPGSVRRTTSIDMTWSDAGDPSTMKQHLHGRARDVRVPSGEGDQVVLGEAEIDATATFDRVIESIRVTPTRDGIEGLVGARGGSQLRGAIDEVLPGERAAGTPLHLLLDDLAGCTLIAGFVWTRFMPELVRARTTDGEEHRRRMEGVCIGFSPGSSSLSVNRETLGDYTQVVTSLVHPEEPEGWHDFPESPEMSMRRARRIDVWRERSGIGDVIRVDSSFQDSSGDPEFGRVAVHEYGLEAVIDAASGALTSVTADPRVLPFLECPGAVDNITRLVGLPVRELRSAVPELLGRTNGCTHLNDALRALAEVPILADQLEG